MVLQDINVSKVLGLNVKRRESELRILILPSQCRIKS